MMLIIAAGAAYCHPKSTCIESRKTIASETEWPPFSSSGTGLNSAATAAARNTHAPAIVLALGGCATTEYHCPDHYRNTGRNDRSRVPK